MTADEARRLEKYVMVRVRIAPETWIQAMVNQPSKLDGSVAIWTPDPITGAFTVPSRALPDDLERA